MRKSPFNIKISSKLGLGLLLYFISSSAFCQQLNIVIPTTGQIIKLADPATFITANQAQASISSAEDAGKLLVAAINKIKEGVPPAQAELSKTETAKSAYSTALTDFDKNDVGPYKKDMANYDAAGKKYTDQLAKYNKAAQASNALPAAKRKAAEVALLNKQRLQVDSMGKQLGAWNARLNAAKAKLDMKNAALNKQQLQYRAAEKGPVTKLRDAKEKFKTIASELQQCAAYAQKCHDARIRLGEPSAAYNGYFTTADYKNAVSDVNLQLVSLQFF
jgi:hypothetical protein